MWLVVVAVLALSIGLLLRRANELCALTLASGGARLIRGRAPARMIADVDEVARRAAGPPATVRVVIESGVPRLLAPDGMPDRIVQQLRNVVGQYQVVHFRTGKRPS
jgi:H+/gluconate symporter-like permease